MSQDRDLDALLQEILRETESQKQQPEPEPGPSPQSQSEFQHWQEILDEPESESKSWEESQPEFQHWRDVLDEDREEPTESIPFEEEYSDIGKTVIQNCLEDDLVGESQAPFLATANSNAKNKKSKRKRNPKRKHNHHVVGALVAAALIIAASVALSVILMIYGRDLLGISSDDSMKIVTIPTGVSVAEVADILEEEGIISQPRFFTFIAGMGDKDTEIMPGDHELRPDMAYETILDELVNLPLDGAISVSVTFPEGIRLVDAAELLEENNVCDSDEFLNYFNNTPKYGYTYESYLPSFQDQKFYKMEGYLFPDTYTFYQDMSVDLVCQKILDNFDQKIKPEYYDRMDALGMSLDDTLTLASIIQKEAGAIDQMKDISSVFWNRLNLSSVYPLLQSDVTIFYVEEVIKPHSNTYNQDLYDSYNTYVCTGLPAGPICNPGSDAIEAALYPSYTNYYYFYADTETGETYYAETLEGHTANQEMVAALHDDTIDWYDEDGDDGEDDDDNTEE